MRAVMYGAGNIGRGFIGALLAAAGYHITFVDVNRQVVAALNERGGYPLRVVSSAGHSDTVVTGVDAVDGSDTAAVAAAIAGADIMATAVGVNVLKHIVPNIAAGLQQRFAKTHAPLNILICENLMDANKVLEGMLKDALPAAAHPLMDERVGLVETSIGRMVPVQTPEMQDGDMLRVCVEHYSYLPADRDAFKGPLPAIDKLVPFSPFSFYLKRKLYIHNLGHALCAYLGLYTGAEYIYQAIDQPDVLVLVRGAMQESMLALAAEYGVPAEQLLLNINDLLHRFTNQALRDTCARVGQDPRRKLARDDRLVGAAENCQKQGIFPAHTAVGIAAALCRLLAEREQPQTRENAAAALQSLAGPGLDDALVSVSLGYYEQLAAGCEVAALRRAAAEQQRRHMGDVV